MIARFECAVLTVCSHCGSADAECAQCVLGNHELNLLRKSRKEGNGWFYDKNQDHLKDKFWNSRPLDPARRPAFADFLLSLPIALERSDLRLVHAAWHAASIDGIRSSSLSALEMYNLHHERVLQLGVDTGLADRANAEILSNGDNLTDLDAVVPMLPNFGVLDALHVIFRPETGSKLQYYDLVSVVQDIVPEDALLKTYRGGARPERWGHHVDCFTVTVERAVSLTDFVFAFYTSRVFRIERLLLSIAFRAPSTDAQAYSVAEGFTNSFAIWRVGERTATQLLMCDRYERTRSWFRVVPDDNGRTVLQFGSAVAASRNRHTGIMVMSTGFRVLLRFHVLYSKLLLKAATDRVIGSYTGNHE